MCFRRFELMFQLKKATERSMKKILLGALRGQREPDRNKNKKIFKSQLVKGGANFLSSLDAPLVITQLWSLSASPGFRIPDFISAYFSGLHTSPNCLAKMRGNVHAIFQK